ncbi:RagB/SusD family nutrient uptake outer membrane protein [Elizabethkingia anophelis]|uniref:RagB/SusD family nutrient uptake outer membrane protein n=1 Tax=Elizabethkingia anophelis TaxID=1117645 RepID=UPI0020126FD3|nr:RagB/SusD family nutrient uptake outer membrane protein [Elizabethkingia anophelis]EJC8059331.1 RagB/SusD family nutrient uptake outer membrane protein [Elizabethkingia anophelis]MCL1641800.1 RagB/SusD family nutrient uptake outer membrane protein [Elizabethkingia anophelis]MCL1644345.1 RagB/SusD family nutrient uptake outer membrane protein [Elizabethkingia anophelis]MCT3923653.1 RagB/SusD family nutrient uptake outer membrane protein [Elizabethkingia anophelis]MCT3926196.1 RagB/SusD famil
MRKITIKILFNVMLIIGLSSCNDNSLEPTLTQSKDLEQNTKTLEDLRTVLNGGYDRMQHPSYYGRDMIIYGEARSDNAFSNANSNRFVTVSQMKMIITDAYPNNTWNKIYEVIGNANIVINKQGAIGDAAQLSHLKGQAYAMRALCHFDLLRLFGQHFITAQGGMNALGVPYVTTFREAGGLFPARGTVQQNYDNIMKDLDQAITLMNSSLDNQTKHYFTSYSANALKARVAAYFKRYDVVEKEAGIVVNSGRYTIATAAGYANTFSQNSTGNVIFSIAMNANDNLGNNSLANIYRGAAYGDIVALKDLYDIYDNGDIRKTAAFIRNNGTSTEEYRNIGKYPSTASPIDDIPVIRIEEIVLLYAEALLANGKVSQALAELNKIPANRNAVTYTNATMQNILLERRKELAFEGFRFDDIARTGMDMPLVDNLRQRYGNVKFGEYKYAFPIPDAEISANSNVKQNFGYK